MLFILILLVHGAALKTVHDKKQSDVDKIDDNDYISANSETNMFCNDLQMKCAFRAGCGMALSSYLVACSSVIHGLESKYCPVPCQHALIGLMSTEEGAQLTKCNCTDQDCAKVKQRIEICRPQVQRAIQKDTIVTCSVAERICATDTSCSTALIYYNRYCRSMFHGKKCSYRCLNSISILERQEKAAKLKTCQCEGSEHYDCNRIKKNMDELCFNKTESRPSDQNHNIDQNRIDGSKAAKCSVTFLISFSLFLLHLLSIP